MAIESYYLRKKISYHLTTLWKMTELTSISDDSVDERFSAVEIKVIEIAALTRKLRDLGKLPDNTLEHTKLDVFRYESKGSDSQRAFANMEKEYNLKKPVKYSLTLARTVDLIIHSYILQATGDKKYLFTGIFVTSDWSRFKGLYWIDLNDFIGACRETVKKYPHNIQAVYDQELKKWVYKRK